MLKCLLIVIKPHVQNSALENNTVYETILLKKCTALWTFGYTSY